MKLINYKFLNVNDEIYAVPLSKWKKYLKMVLAYKLSLVKKKPLEEPKLFSKDIKLIAFNMFEFSKLNADDSVDIIKEEIAKIENLKESI